MHDKTHRQQNIKIAILLNVSFTVIELIGGLLTNSLAIISDALHDFGDSVALIVSWVAERKASSPPDSKRTFGYQRVSLFSAIFAGLVLLGGSLFLLSEAIPRLLNPEHVNAQGMIILAVIGVIFNGAGFLRLKRGTSMNEKVLSWHLLEDVLGWVVIFVGAIIILFWDIHIIDPIMTIGYTIYILWGVGKNMKESLNILMQGVPTHIDLKAIRQALLEIQDVNKIHDIHIWSLEGETDVFTGHLVVQQGNLKDSDDIRRQVKMILTKYHIEHSTIEIETEAFCSGSECEEKSKKVSSKTQ